MCGGREEGLPPGVLLLAYRLTASPPYTPDSVLYGLTASRMSPMNV